MKKLVIIALIGALFTSQNVIADDIDKNPWEERYSKAKTDSTTTLPSELPIVADAISTARKSIGIESVITFEEAEKTIAQALEQEGAGDNISAEIIERSKKKGSLASGNSTLTFEVSAIDYNAKELSWEATIKLIEDQKQLSAIELKGTYDEAVEVPVLVRRIRRDEVITEADIKWHTVKSSRLRNDTAMQIEQIIGQTPRRTISPNRSVRLAELAKPSVVHKNDQVTLQFRSGTMEIRTLGEAMQEGAVGDIIRIRNKDSNQPVQARILAAGLAETMPLGILAQAKGNY